MPPPEPELRTLAPPGPAPAHLSFPPGVSITWPIVAYALVRELPYVLMVISGCIMGIVLVAHAEGNTLAGLGAALGPVIIAALSKSQPAESQTILRILGTRSGDGR